MTESNDQQWSEPTTSAPVEPEQVSPEAPAVENAPETPVPSPEQPAEDAPKPGDVVTSPEGKSDEEGVKTGGLTYTVNEDGTRDYHDQEKVDVTVHPAE